MNHRGPKKYFSIFIQFSFLVGILLLTPLTAVAQGVSCTLNSDCQSGERCTQTNLCIDSCDTDSDCSSGQQCLSAGGDDIEGNLIKLCFTPCFASDACSNVTFTNYLTNQQVPTCCSSYMRDFGANFPPNTQDNVCVPNDPPDFALPCNFDLLNDESACFDGVDNGAGNNGVGDGKTDCADSDCQSADNGFPQSCNNCAQAICDPLKVGDPCGGDGSKFDNNPNVTVALGQCFSPALGLGDDCGPGQCLCVPHPSDDACPAECFASFSPDDIKTYLTAIADLLGIPVSQYVSSLQGSGCMMDEASSHNLCSNGICSNSQPPLPPTCSVGKVGEPCQVHSDCNTGPNPFCVNESDEIPADCNNPATPKEAELCQSCINWTLSATDFPIAGFGSAGCGALAPTWAQGDGSLFGLLLHFDDSGTTNGGEVAFAVNNNSCVAVAHEHNTDAFGGHVAFLTSAQSASCHQVLINATATTCDPPNCDDGNSCTDDSCAATGCTHTNNTASCDDGDACTGTPTTSDRCSGGSCVPGPTTLNCGKCTRTMGYWKNHPDAWPVASISVGEDTYTKAQAINILNSAGKSDANQLAAQLITAKLNQFAPASSCVNTILAADSFFNGPIDYNSTLTKAQKNTASALVVQLTACNQSGDSASFCK